MTAQGCPRGRHQAQGRRTGCKMNLPRGPGPAGCVRRRRKGRQVRGCGAPLLRIGSTNRQMK
eukprot:5518759-Alexandrium_andersonii.AAC.1